MRPKFWYCPFCGYMFMDTGKSSAGEACCPMCGEEAISCWECIRSGEFDKALCKKCENKSECSTKFKERRFSKSST